jgi:hypothetical protein
MANGAGEYNVVCRTMVLELWSGAIMLERDNERFESGSDVP